MLKKQIMGDILELKLKVCKKMIRRWTHESKTTEVIGFSYDSSVDLFFAGKRICGGDNDGDSRRDGVNS